MKYDSYGQPDWVSNLIDSGEQVIEKWMSAVTVGEKDGKYYFYPRKYYFVDCKEHSGYIAINFGNANHNCIYAYDVCFNTEEECWGYCNKINSIERSV